MQYTFLRKSLVSGKVRQRTYEVTPEGLDRWHRGAMVQSAFPYLTPGEREFIQSGITEEEWDAMFAEDADA